MVLEYWPKPPPKSKPVFLAPGKANQGRCTAATTEILQSQLNYTESQRQLEIAKLALEIAEENSRLAEKRYEAGVGTTIEVSDAQVALEEAKYNELSARYNLYLAGIQYEKSLGRYRQEPQDQGSEK